VPEATRAADLDSGAKFRLQTGVPSMFATLVVCLLASVAIAEENENASSLSPDKKWAYRLTEGEPAIVRAETGEVVFKLGDEGSFMVPNSGEVLWAPDSRRLALNYRAGTRYYACAVYELAGDKWKQLPDLETKATKVVEMIARAEQRQRKRQGATKSAYRRRIDDTWKVRRWIDADTFEASASSEATVVLKKESDDLGSLSTTVLFTVKCDNRGGWRIIQLHEASTAELKKLNADE
jgi:hypothetical protein